MIELPRIRSAERLVVWIDIENPPQVQYLLPFRDAFDAAGIRCVITARDYGSTLELLRNAGVNAHVFGTRVGRGRLRKASATAERARDLWHLFSSPGMERPHTVLSASRAAAIAAWRLRIPSFVIIDYEHVQLGVFRHLGSTIVFPDVIDAAHFRRSGLRPEQLVPVRGLKEDLTFAGVDVDAIAPLDLGPGSSDAVRVLFRPPSETSHYYRTTSTTMARVTLERLAHRGALVVFSPREAGQVSLLAGLPWKHEPITFNRPVPFISALKSVDAVVCSGGTMLREAAYLGIPSYSILQSHIGGVDRWLQSIGRAKLIAGPDDLDALELKPRGPLRPLHSNAHLLEQIITLVTAKAREVLGEPALVA